MKVHIEVIPTNDQSKCIKLVNVILKKLDERNTKYSATLELKKGRYIIDTEDKK